MRIERGQNGKCSTGWLLNGVKIVLLLFQCRQPEQSLPSKINYQNFSFVQGRMYHFVEPIGNLYAPESYVWSLTIGLSLTDACSKACCVVPGKAFITEGEGIL